MTLFQMDERFKTIEDRRLSISVSISGILIAEVRMNMLQWSPSLLTLYRLLWASWFVWKTSVESWPDFCVCGYNSAGFVLVLVESWWKRLDFEYSFVTSISHAALLQRGQSPLQRFEFPYPILPLSLHHPTVPDQFHLQYWPLITSASVANSLPTLGPGVVCLPPPPPT